MALDQVASFLGSLTSSDGPDLKKALANGKSGDKLGNVVDALVSVGNAKGHSFSKEELEEYLRHLKTQYYTNPTVKILMDSHCKSSCHIGSQIKSTQLRV